MRFVSRRGCPGPLRWVAALSMGLGVLGCSGSHEPRRVPLPQAERAQVAPTTDVPALLGISIDGLRHRLGPAQPLPTRLMTSEAGTLLYASQGQLDSLIAFRTGGMLMLATYNTHSRQVRDLLLLGQHEDSLMGRAHLRSNAANYLVMPVFHNTRSFQLLGLRIIPIK